mgnify:CR=1 FL=1
MTQTKKLAPHGFQHQQGFTLVELIVVIAIIGLLSGVVFSVGISSWQRSRANAVAIGIAAWLNTIHANTTASTSNANVTCAVTFAGNAAYPAANSFHSGSIVFTVSNGSSATNRADATDCQPIYPSFAVPDDLPGTYQIASPTPIIYNLRGNVLVGDAASASTSNLSGLASNRDIKVYASDSRLLRCIRINFLLGLTTIGSKAGASGVNDNCESNSFGSFVSEKF